MAADAGGRAARSLGCVALLLALCVQHAGAAVCGANLANNASRLTTTAHRRASRQASTQVRLTPLLATLRYSVINGRQPAAQAAGRHSL